MDQRYYNVSNAESPYASLGQYMSATFTWMFLGLLVTFGVAMATVFSGAFYFLYGTGLVFVLSIVELILVFVLSAKVYTLQPATATGLFFAYAALNGINLSVYLVVYDLASLLLAFLVGAVYFGIMAVYGNRTSRDLSGWGPMLFGALITLIVVTVVGGLLSMFGILGFGTLDLVVSAVGLLIFMAFTAYDTQKLKYYYSTFGGDEVMLHKSAVIGALDLYLDYINIFIYILRILGRSRRN